MNRSHRLVPAISCLVMFSLFAPRARADKAHEATELDVKPWSLAWLRGGADVNETEPNDLCPDLANPFTLGDTFHGVLTPADSDFLSFTCIEGNRITIGTDADGALPTADTFLELYQDDCATLLASDDDGGPGLYSLISNFVAPYTGTYYLLIRGFSQTSTGNYICVGSCSVPPPPPPNNVCNTATPVPNCTTYTDSGDSENATNDYSPAAVFCCEGCTGYYAIGPDVVYRLDLAGDEALHIEYTQTNADASMYIITDCSDPIASCVAGADDTFFGDTETLDWVAPGAGTYYLICDVFSGDGSPFTLSITTKCTLPVEAKSWGGSKGHYRHR